MPFESKNWATEDNDGSGLPMALLKVEAVVGSDPESIKPQIVCIHLKIHKIHRKALHKSKNGITVFW
jgi:hypothetical protein